MEPLEGNELQKFMFGAEYADKLERFNRGLNDIEKKYPELFKERKAKLFPEEEDKLGFHYMMTFNSNQVVFGFIEESDLPNYVKDECVVLFNKIYNQQQ